MDGVFQHGTPVHPVCLDSITVTGPPGALLFDRDQRSHCKNHFNCYFVRVAAWAFIAQISCHRC